MAEGDSCMIREVARQIGIGGASLAKVVVQLTKQGLVSTKRGCRGGITLARPPETITLLQVVKAFENEEWIGACPFGLPECPAQGQCPAHLPWNHLRHTLQSLLANTTVADVMRAMPPPPKEGEMRMSRTSERRPVFCSLPEAAASASVLR